jgi:hypothetical protein
LARRR